MRFLWLRLITLGLVAAITGTAMTLAFFTSMASIDNNVVTAGTLKINLNRVDDTLPGPMFYTTTEEGRTSPTEDNLEGLPGLNPTGTWAPGVSHMRVLQVESTGTIDGRLKSVGATLENGDSPLADVLWVEIFRDNDPSQILASGTLRDFIVADKLLNPPINLAGDYDGPFGDEYYGDVGTLNFKVTLPSTVNNDYQGLSFKTAFTVQAEQIRNNP